MNVFVKTSHFLPPLPSPPLPMADDGQSLGESQMALSLSLPRGDRKTRLRLPPPQPAVAKSWHCQEDRERKEEDGVWPSLRVPLRNRLHLLIWAKSDSNQILQFPFMLHCMWIYAPEAPPVFYQKTDLHPQLVPVQHLTINSFSHALKYQLTECVWQCETPRSVFFVFLRSIQFF